MTRIKILFVLLFLGFVSAQSQTQDRNLAGASSSTLPKAEKLLRHVVLFKFKNNSSTEQIKQVEDAFMALPAMIKEIYDFEWGTNNSPENLNKEFTHSFLVSFTSEKDRAIYLPHPAHLAFVEVLKPHLDDVLVLDYWTK